MSDTSVPKGIKFLLIITTLSVVLVFLTAFVKYIFANDYYFLVEAPCDSETNTCFVRDCEDYCPPNGYDVYRTFTVQASEFKNCTDNTCQNICLLEEQNACEEVVCDSENGDECTE